MSPYPQDQHLLVVKTLYHTRLYPATEDTEHIKNLGLGFIIKNHLDDVEPELGFTLEILTDFPERVDLPGDDLVFEALLPAKTTARLLERQIDPTMDDVNDDPRWRTHHCRLHAIWIMQADEDEDKDSHPLFVLSTVFEVWDTPPPHLE